MRRRHPAWLIVATSWLVACHEPDAVTTTTPPDAADTHVAADTSDAAVVDTRSDAATATDSVTIDDTIADTVAPPDTSPTTEPPDATAPPEDTTTAPETIVPEPTFPRGCADPYDPDVLPTFELDFAPGEWDALRADCVDGVQRYRSVTFRWGAEAVPAMARLKGNWSWSCDKYQFVISFNELDSQGRFHGLRKLVLDAPWYDPTLLRERLAMDTLARIGVPYSCVNHARLVIDGAYYGVYANLERLDREYLERHFDDPDGNLYEAGVELKTNEDEADTSDRDAYWAAPDVAALGAIVDLAHAVRVWAAEAMLPDLDGYWAGVDINWYLYHHPARGFLYLTYDADVAFAADVWPGAAEFDPITWEHPGWGREPQYVMVMEDPAWCDAFVVALTRARAAYDVPRMQADVRRWAAQIEAAVADDPHRTFSLEAHLAAVDDLVGFVAARAAFIDDWLATSHCPVRWP